MEDGGQAADHKLLSLQDPLTFSPTTCLLGETGRSFYFLLFAGPLRWFPVPTPASLPCCLPSPEQCCSVPYLPLSLGSQEPSGKHLGALWLDMDTSVVVSLSRAYAAFLACSPFPTFLPPFACSK